MTTMLSRVSSTPRLIRSLSHSSSYQKAGHGQQRQQQEQGQWGQAVTAGAALAIGLATGAAALAKAKDGDLLTSLGLTVKAERNIDVMEQEILDKENRLVLQTTYKFDITIKDDLFLKNPPVWHLGQDL